MMVIKSLGRSTASRGLLWLLLIMTVAFLSRAVALWWARPEFMGWFNHAPWYWVQTRGLLEDGVLPFADLPLLFHGYAMLAGGFMILGQEMAPAIVNAQRLAMCLVPAMMAIPCWAVVRAMQGDRVPGWAEWALVVLATFLPLTFAHLPELLQKNMLGLLLLALLMAATQASLRRPAWGLSMALVFLLIALTHLGTLAVAMLWLLAVAGSLAFSRGAPGRLPIVLMAPVVAVAAGIGLLAVFDADALARVGAFLATGWRNSLLGHLLGPGDLARRGLALTGIVLPLALLLPLLRAWRQAQSGLDPSNRVFWLANLLFAYLLVLPIYDLEVVPRLVLFLPLPVLFLMAFHLQHGRRPRLVRGVVLLATVGALVMTAGEVANLLRPLPDKAAVRAELAALDDRECLTEGDLVIAPYAVTSVANWFLGTRAALVTSVYREDFDRYDRVYVLNSGWELPTAPGDLLRVSTSAERYRAMRQAVPLPETLTAEPTFRTFSVYRLDGPPPDWRFDETGRWAGRCAEATCPP